MDELLTCNLTLMKEEKLQQDLALVWLWPSFIGRSQTYPRICSLGDP